MLRSAEGRVTLRELNDSALRLDDILCGVDKHNLEEQLQLEISNLIIRILLNFAKGKLRRPAHMMPKVVLAILRSHSNSKSTSLITQFMREFRTGSFSAVKAFFTYISRLTSRGQAHTNFGKRDVPQPPYEVEFGLKRCAKRVFLNVGLRIGQDGCKAIGSSSPRGGVPSVCTICRWRENCYFLGGIDRNH